MCGLPLGSTAQLRPAAMVNLLGDLWVDGEPDWSGALAIPDVKLHLYGKTRPARRTQDGPPDRARRYRGRGGGEGGDGEGPAWVGSLWLDGATPIMILACGA